MKKNIILLMAFTVFLLSCNHKNKNVKKKGFQNSYELNGKTILKDNSNVLYLYLADTLLLAKLNGDDYHFSVFNSKNLKYLGKLARKGKGPNELPDVLQFEHHIIKNNQLKIWVYGWNTGKIYLINVSNSLKNQNTTIDTILKVSPEIKFSSIFVTDNYKIIGNTRNTTTNMRRFLIYDIGNNKILKEVGPFPKIENDNQDITFIFYKYNFLFLSSLGSNPEHTKFASPMYRLNRMDIFDKKGNVINSYIGKNNNTKAEIDEFFKTEIGKYANLKMYYSDAKTTGNFIYSIYYNQLVSNSNSSDSVKVRIFNWKAEPVCEINIPDHLTSIAIDEKNGIMYGVAYFDEKILKYDIKDILDEIK